ncbi:histidine-containing phosphotransfer protein 1-like isoform X1 [Zingiber officinale]|uniref:histidine-containing phosphotransfer protein 1-like isoform X1 n=1 Tax=Zingiber officinale TaxID=94328 RepID=UPI001C4CA84C|nr:histidine-containing phosphotransfer protein 1-like isoform X1 [Zingiber officinale]
MYDSPINLSKPTKLPSESIFLITMEIANSQRRYVDFTSTLFNEGYLDSQFTQLQQLQDESNPEFVLEVVTLFFEDSEKLLDELTRTLDQKTVDFKKVDAHVHQLKGSSASIGAQRVKNVCVAFRNFCEEMNREGCLRCLRQVKNEYFLVKSKLKTFFALEQKIVAVGGSIPMMW